VDENDVPTLVTIGCGRVVVDQKSLPVTKTPYKESQREKILDSRCTIRAKVCGLIINGGNCWPLTPLLTNFKFLSRSIQLPTLFNG